MSVLQRPWHLATEHARLIEMPGALFHFSFDSQRGRSYPPRGLQGSGISTGEGERISSVMIHSRQRAIRMRWCVLLSALWHVLALLASELLPGPSVKRLALRSSMFSPRSLADGIGDRLHLRSATV